MCLEIPHRSQSFVAPVPIYMRIQIKRFFFNFFTKITEVDDVV